MKGKFDRDNCLVIDRGNGFTTQGCPFNALSEKCGTWCPHFGTVETMTRQSLSRHFNMFSSEDEKHKQKYTDILYVLSICHGKKLVFDEFEVES